jgi:hypothetical protein
MTTLDVTSFGASPSNSDDTDNIQRALDRAVRGDTVWVPPGGEHRVDALRSLKPRSGTKFKIDGVLRAIPTSERDYAVVDVRESDVTVLGSGTIAGERYQHLPAKEQGRHGSCLQLFNSVNASVSGVTLQEAWGDGLYIQGARSTKVDRVMMRDNARNACAIISANTLSIQNCVMTATHSEGPYPQAGIDIEPDTPAHELINILITMNQFVRNKGAGCYIAFEPAANRTKVMVVNNFFDQHYKDDSGPPIGGRNSRTANLLYASCRWIPGYDWWAFTREFTC